MCEASYMYAMQNILSVKRARARTQTHHLCPIVVVMMDTICSEYNVLC